MSLFCRHNRFVADCPICAKGTVLDSGQPRRRSPGEGGTARRSRAEKPSSPEFSGPHAGAGPHEDEDGMRYELRLERVPGGARLAEWSGSRLRRKAPAVSPADLRALVDGAAGVFAPRDAEALAAALDRARAGSAAEAAAFGVSRGRSGDFKEELRVEALEDGRLRVARWVLRPGSGWQLQDAPPMLPAARFAEAIGDAVSKGVVKDLAGMPNASGRSPASGAGAATRP